MFIKVGKLNRNRRDLSLQRDEHREPFLRIYLTCKRILRQVSLFRDSLTYKQSDPHLVRQPILLNLYDQGFRQLQVEDSMQGFQERAQGRSRYSHLTRALEVSTQRKKMESRCLTKSSTWYSKESRNLSGTKKSKENRTTITSNDSSLMENPNDRALLTHSSSNKNALHVLIFKTQSVTRLETLKLNSFSTNCRTR